MCLACATSIDQQQVDGFTERVIGWINASFTMQMLSIGHQTGLFDRMATLAPSTSGQIAAAAGLDERYVRECLGALATAGVVRVDSEGRRFHLPPEHAMRLTRSADVNLAKMGQWSHVTASVEPQIVKCFHEGGGVPYDQYPRFNEVMAEESAQTTVGALDSHIIPAVEGLDARLREGIEVVDIGCGSGLAMIHLARRYPRSQFTGLDATEGAIAIATDNERRAGVNNIRFARADAAAWNATGQYDLVTAFDAIHDQAEPDRVLANIRRALRPGGVFLMQDINASSNVADNVGSVLGPMIYGISCMHCMSVSLSAGGAGLGAAWGWQLAERMLAEAGFDSVQRTDLEHDILNTYYICRV